jgi:predicted ATPase/class 3 adenylate cyclase
VSVPPSGSVTFLFTDIEGSTQLWEHQRALMQAAVARHDALLRGCIEGNRGYVFKTVGDAFCAAFPTAEDGVRAVAEAQRAVATEPWDPTCVVRVRAGLHTGEPEERDADYFGPPVNRVARLMSAGHGGQTLISQATLDDAGTLPEGLTLQDLGRHRLKDLVEPEHIYQLQIPDLPAEFPPIKSLDYRPTNLPVQPTDFIGRQDDLRAITDMVCRENVRLVTLTGPGGTGKTRLAMQVGAELIDEFADGVYFVDLAPLTDSSLVLSTIAGALHVHEAGGRPLKDLLVDHLRDKRMLLIFDNFEHLLDAATVVSDLLAAPKLTVLVTSRAILHLKAEREYPVSPLAVPDPNHLPSLHALEEFDSVQLFVERARAVKPGFELTEENAEAIARICHRLDGLPLALELAAARVRLFPPAALLARLSQRLKLLTGGARDLPERQQTLRSAIDWSFSLLDPGEQRLFARLGVFSGGCTFEAAELICNGDGSLDVDVLDGLTSLVEKSLIRQVEEADEPRFTMLETVREYATEQLDAGGDGEILQEEHAAYFQQVAADSEVGYHSPDQETWLARLEAEHDNMRAGLAWALQGPDDEQAAAFAASLQWFWYLHGYLTEGRRWLDQALERAGESRSRARVHALIRDGALAIAQGNFDGAQRLLEEGLTLARETGDQGCLAEALNELGKVAGYRGDYQRAQELMEESLSIYRRLNHTFRIGTLTNDLGGLAFFSGDYDRARPLLEEALAIARKLRQKRVIAIELNNLACIANREGDPQRAKTLLEEALPLFQEVGDKWFISRALEELGLSLAMLGECPVAATWMGESLTVLRELDDELGMAEWLEYQAQIAAIDGKAERAARLHGAAAGVRKELGALLAPAEEATLEGNVASARESLGGGWQEHWDAGTRTTLGQAIAYALEGEEVPASASSG